ncbi:MAG: BPTI/Kunitz domain-containing protein [Desulfobacterales bacterium]|nr:BPTI/Kunitz domain-containing protein [Desulfobacterales bacterium]
MFRRRGLGGFFVAALFLLLPPTVTQADMDEGCLLSPDPGPCKALFWRYYFDRDKGRCERFIWGGCGGVVPFESLEDCQKACESPSQSGGPSADAITGIRPSGVAEEKNDPDRVLKKAYMKATISAIEMEIGRFGQKLKAAKEGPGDPGNVPELERRIGEFRAELGKYERMTPAEYVVPESRTVEVRPTHAYRQGSLLELTDMTRSGPFYHMAGIRGDDYGSLKPNKAYRMTIYLVYPRDYFFSNHYVYIDGMK